MKKCLFNVGDSVVIKHLSPLKNQLMGSFIILKLTYYMSIGVWVCDLNNGSKYFDTHLKLIKPKYTNIVE